MLLTIEYQNMINNDLKNYIFCACNENIKQYSVMLLIKFYNAIYTKDKSISLIVSSDFLRSISLIQLRIGIYIPLLVTKEMHTNFTKKKKNMCILNITTCN